MAQKNFNANFACWTLWLPTFVVSASQLNRRFRLLNRVKCLKSKFWIPLMITSTVPVLQKAGYDGVEIMGSEGYLLNQFLSCHVNQREDRWGRLKTVCVLRVEIVKGIRAQVGEKFIICFRLSLLDLVHDGNTMKEVVTIAQALEKQALPY